MDNPYLNIHKELIEACRKSDRDAQFRIYKLYYKAMYNTSLRIVNDSAEAEDIMQEAFLDAFQRIDSYTGEGSFGSWLKRIVINRSLDALRRSREIHSIEEEELDFAEEAEDSSEEEIFLQVQEIKTAMEQLPDDHRVILSLLLLEGYDHEEISQILGISNQLSRTRYSRARQNLLKVIREKRNKRSFIYN